MSQPIAFTSTTPRFALPFLFAGQAQKEFFVNEGFATIDALLHPVVEGLLSVPPATYQAGNAWIVANNAEAAWEGKDAQLAVSDGSDWRFVAPSLGMNVYDLSLGQIRHFDGQWQLPISPTAPAGGAVVDNEARAAILQLVDALRLIGLLA